MDDCWVLLWAILNFSSAICLLWGFKWGLKVRLTFSELGSLLSLRLLFILKLRFFSRRRIIAGSYFSTEMEDNPIWEDNNPSPNKRGIMWTYLEVNSTSSTVIHSSYLLKTVLRGIGGKNECRWITRRMTKKSYLCWWMILSSSLEKDKNARVNSDVSLSRGIIPYSFGIAVVVAISRSTVACFFDFKNFVAAHLQTLHGALFPWRRGRLVCGNRY